MRVILDENVPYPLLGFLSHHLTTTVQREGWAGIKNRELLKLIEPRFDVFVLGDQNLRYQQNLTNRRIAIVELSTIRWPHLKLLISAIVAAIDGSKPGGSVVLGAAE